MEIIEDIDQWRERYASWNKSGESDASDSYPIVQNKRAPFVPARRALPMLNLALISSAGAYIDGTEPFDPTASGGDVSFREIPTEIGAGDLKFVSRGYSGDSVQRDINVQLPIDRLFEFVNNGIIGQLNPVFWSFCGFISDAARLVSGMLPPLVDRIKRDNVQAALLIPASRLCHQSVALLARALELGDIPTMMLGVERDVVDKVRPPRAAYYKGTLGSVVGPPDWPEFQRRVLDQSLRQLEPMDQPAVVKLTIELETEVRIGRGER